MEVAELSSQVQVLKARAAAAGTGRPGGAVGGPRARPTCAGPASPNVSPGRPGEAARRAAGVPASPGRRGAQQKAGGAGAGAEAEVVEVLRQQLAKSEAALRGAQERLAVVEAKAAVAQEAAGKGEYLPTYADEPRNAALLADAFLHLLYSKFGTAATTLYNASYGYGDCVHASQASSSWTRCTAAWWAARWSTVGCSRSWTRRGRQPCASTPVSAT